MHHANESRHLVFVMFSFGLYGFLVGSDTVPCLPQNASIRSDMFALYSCARLCDCARVNISLFYGNVLQRIVLGSTNSNFCAGSISHISLCSSIFHSATGALFAFLH